MPIERNAILINKSLFPFEMVQYFINNISKLKDENALKN